MARRAEPLYWVHQFQEYSLPVIGIDYSIQQMICEKIGFPVSGMPDSAGLLPGGEHRAHVVRGAAGGATLPARRPHRPQFLGIALRQRICTYRGRFALGGHTTGRWTAAFLLFHCPAGSLTPARFADRTATRSLARRKPPELSIRSRRRRIVDAAQSQNGNMHVLPFSKRLADVLTRRKGGGAAGCPRSVPKRARYWA